MSTRIEQAVPEQVRLHGVYSAARARIDQAGETFERRKVEKAEDQAAEAEARVAEQARKAALQAHERRESARAVIDAARIAKMTAYLPKYVRIQSIVADRYRISRARMLKHKRTMKLVLPRQIAMFLMKEFIPSMSLPDIGRRFGARDHTTVLHALRKIEGLVRYGGDVADAVAELRLLIASIPEPERISVVESPPPPRVRVWATADAALIEGIKGGVKASGLSKQLGIPYSTVFCRLRVLRAQLEVSPSPQIAGADA